MKTRITFVLSCYAFIHAGLIAIGLTLADVLHLSQSDLGPLGIVLKAYFTGYRSSFGNDLGNMITWWGSPTIWLGLWITTGKPRFLPWQVWPR